MIDWSKLKTQEEILSQKAESFKSMISNRRYLEEVGGIEVNGFKINTDDRSKLLINGAAFEASLNPSYLMDWKTPDGFVTLNADEIIFIARKVRAHVQACFNRESELLTALEGGTFNVEMLEEGWPTDAELLHLMA